MSQPWFGLGRQVLLNETRSHSQAIVSFSQSYQASLIDPSRNPTVDGFDMVCCWQ
jgi:hypothetical protein